MTDILQLSEEDIHALKMFRRVYPTWWYTIGFCDRSRDFTAAPQANSPEITFAEMGGDFDQGFMCDHPKTLADAIGDVMLDINIALEKKRRHTQDDLKLSQQHCRAQTQEITNLKVALAECEIKLAGIRKKSKWRLISSAPKDGSTVIGYSPTHGQRKISWNANYERFDENGYSSLISDYTHWRDEYPNPNEEAAKCLF